MVPDRFAPVLAELAPLAGRFAAHGHRLHLVGGTVRDLLLGLDASTVDIDLTTDARPPEIKRCLDGWADAIWTQGERFGTIGAQRRSDSDEALARTYEITTHRSEAYTDHSRKPHVTFADDLEADLSRRDFTINAMALELTGGASPVFADPFGGAADLEARTLRTPLDPEISFSDDPLRMLRAARFIAAHAMTPAPGVAEAVGRLAHRIQIVSPERLRVELDKLMLLDHPTSGLWFLVETGLAEQFLPELPAMRPEHDPLHRHEDLLTHTLAVVENVRPPHEHPRGHRSFDFRITRLAALFHDIGRPRTRADRPGPGETSDDHEMAGARMTRARMQALRYSNDDVDAVTALVALHRRGHGQGLDWTDSAVRRYVRDAGPLLAELNALTRSNCAVRSEPMAGELSARMDELERRIAELEASEELMTIRPELDGREVMERLGVASGPLVGEALDMLLELRLEEGPVGRDEALRRLDAWALDRRLGSG